jgi:hypothetical protein
MAETLKKLAQSLIDTTVETVYTVPGSTTTIIKHIVITNNTAGAVTGITIYHDGNADVNCILPGVDLAAGEWGEFEGVIAMEAADTLQVKSLTGDDVAAITVYGMEFS